VDKTLPEKHDKDQEVADIAYEKCLLALLAVTL